MYSTKEKVVDSVMTLYVTMLKAVEWGGKVTFYNSPVTSVAYTIQLDSVRHNGREFRKYGQRVRRSEDRERTLGVVRIADQRRLKYRQEVAVRSIEPGMYVAANCSSVPGFN